MNNITDEELEEMHTLTATHVAENIKMYLTMREGGNILNNDSNFETIVKDAECIVNTLTLTLANGQVFSVLVTLVADDPSKRKEEKEGFRVFLAKQQECNMCGLSDCMHPNDINYHHRDPEDE